MSNKL